MTAPHSRACVLGVATVGFVGLGVPMSPCIVPTQITIYEAAAPRNAQIFVLVRTGTPLPIILAFTAYAYWVFRGKVDPNEGYH